MNRNQRLRIVVTGLAATYPFGGVFWDYMQYVLGFKRLGHDVLYLEDTGQWCYSPAQQTFVEAGDDNARVLAEHITRLDPDLADRWCYRDATERAHGLDWAQAQRFCREADVFVNISAACRMRDVYHEAARTVFIDSDPMYTQASVPEAARGEAEEAEAERVAAIARHDVFFTFGLNVGQSDCRIPTELFEWHPTVQPILLDWFDRVARPIGARRPMLTTVASWEPREDGPVVDGVTYRGKSVEFERFIDLPRRSALPLELALSGDYPAQRLAEHGWHVVPAPSISHDPWVYADYLADSLGEWSVAKNAYVAGRTGWFSCRSACYLAAGVPAVVQSTGFEPMIPTGQGLLSFNTLDDAVAAIDAVASDPQRHSTAARELARTHFASDDVLASLLDRVFASQSHVQA